MSKLLPIQQQKYKNKSKYDRSNLLIPHYLYNGPWFIITEENNKFLSEFVFT